MEEQLKCESPEYNTDSQVEELQALQTPTGEDTAKPCWMAQVWCGMQEKLNAPLLSHSYTAALLQSGFSLH